jgi:DNA replication licensing factor MCM5
MFSNRARESPETLACNSRRNSKPSFSTSGSTTTLSTGAWCQSIERNRGILTLRFRDQLRENALLKKYYCDVNINDLISFNEELAHRLASEPAEIIPLVR